MKKLKYILCLLLLMSLNTIQSQDCENYVIKQDCSGLEGFEDQDVQDAACVLSDSINVPNNSDDFKIYSYDFYTPLAYVEPDLKFETSYARMEADLEELDYYLAMVREHIALNDDFNMLGDKEIKYVVRLKLPDVAPYNELNEIELQAIARSLEAELNNDPKKIVDIETEVNALLGLVSKINAQLIATNLETFEQAGFSNVNVDDHFFEIITGNPEQIDSYGPVYDLAEATIMSDGNVIILADLMEQAIATSDMPTSGFIITSNAMENYDQKISIAEDIYENSTEASITWIHFEGAVTGAKMVYKTKVNWSLQESLNFIDNLYIERMEEYWANGEEDIVTIKGEEDNTSKSRTDCGQVDCNFTIENWFSPGAFAKQWRAYCCVVEGGTCSSFGFVPGSEFTCGLASGVLDGVWETLIFIADAGSGLAKASKHVPFTLSWLSDLIDKSYTEGSFTKALSDKWNEDKKFWKDIVDTLQNLYDNKALIFNAIVESMTTFIQNLTFQNGIAKAGYSVGKLIFEVILTYFTGGAKLISGIGTKISSFTKSAMTSLKNFGSNPVSGIKNIVSSSLNHIKNTGDDILVWFKCTGGCFVKDTPVLMVGNTNQFSLRNSTKALAVAAAIPIVAVPIQDVQLLDYAVAHETVNATYGLTASTDEDIYTGLNDKDPYTSDQQRERDEYEINDTDWNEVVFEEVHGASTAKLALHHDWINQKGYQVDGVVNLDLPEQGISGPFRITSIKHIIPPKKPVDDNESDSYNYKPVTALFTHVSSQIYNIRFDNGESLGVTYQHPIFSVTAGGWRLAGELEIGEQVLTKDGEGTVTSSVKNNGSEIVYNLEVNELHNFLVGKSGIVVHNSYFSEAFKKINELAKIFKNHPNISFKNLSAYDGAILLHRLAGKHIGVNPSKLDEFANAVASENWTKLNEMGLNVSTTNSGAAKAISKSSNPNKRYRTPEVKKSGPNKDKRIGNIETKQEGVNWADWDAPQVPSNPSVGKVSNIHVELNI